MNGALDIAVLGHSLRSAWGNGHAPVWRALVRSLRRRGHRVRFYERERPWHADLQEPANDVAACMVSYDGVEDLWDTHGRDIAAADLVLLGSFVPQGALVADWLLRSARGIVAFYDFDTPDTLAKLRDDACEYLAPPQAGRFHLYLSAVGGPVLECLRGEYHACAQPLYFAADAERHVPLDAPPRYDMGYLATYSPDRQKALRWYLLGVASAMPGGCFVVAGAQYPDNIAWPSNVERQAAVPSQLRPAFHASQRFALNLTRASLAAVGWAPGQCLFEAAACGVPVISDAWPGIDEFFATGKEILLVHEPGQVLEWLQRMPQTSRRVIGAAARRRVLAEHTFDHRVATLEGYLDRLAGSGGMVAREHVA